jgi:hypothetical protein
MQMHAGRIVPTMRPIKEEGTPDNRRAFYGQIQGTIRRSRQEKQPRIRESERRRKMSKHTPGPWEVNYTKATTQIKPNDGHGIVATIPVRYSKTDNLAENAANARLIAAAPELLEALKEQIEPRAKGWKVTDWKIRDANARAAIAKAEKGETK